MTWRYDLKNVLEDDFDVYLADIELNKLNDIISSLLYKQRMACAETLRLYVIENGFDPVVYGDIINVPEPNEFNKK